MNRACDICFFSGANNSESIQSVGSRVANALKHCEGLYLNCLIVLVASQTVTSVAQSLYVGANLKFHSTLPPPLPSKARPLDKVAGASVKVGPDTATAGVAEGKREINMCAFHFRANFPSGRFIIHVLLDTSAAAGTFTGILTNHHRCR